MPDGSLLAVAGLDVYYGRAHILADVAIDVRPGEVVVLLGRNGAGKSTTLKGIMGLVPSASGTIRFDGRDIAGWKPHAIAQAGLGYVPEDRRVFADLTVAENLETGRQPARSDAPHWTAARLFGLFPELAELRGRRGGRLSGGEQQMLTIARTLMGNPRAVLLDEPGEGLAPLVVERMAAAILELKRDGLAIVLSDQNFRFAARVSDRAFVIEKGRIVHSGSMAELAADAELRARVLGLGRDPQRPDATQSRSLSID